MNKKIIILTVVIIIIVAAVITFNKTKPAPETANTTNNTPPAPETVNTNNTPTPEVVPDAPEANKPVINQAAVKEFTMTSFVEFVGDQPKPQYSLKEITVNQGDKVRLKITVTKGTHDFNLDEFNVKAATPLNQAVVVEFTADKAGEFIYYCSMPGHRSNGHWGTLKVLAQ